jgi:nucleoside-diphosphate-sugar epimerase
MPSALILGITGYAGSALARLLVERGWEVRGIGRSETAAADLDDLGVQVEIADIAEGQELRGIGRSGDHVFYLVGSVNGSRGWINRVGLRGVEVAEAELADTGIASFVLVQTLAPYGRGSRDLITEATQDRPNSQLGRVSVRAEEHLREALRERKFPVRFVRAGTIYGPGRRTIQSLRDGRLRMIGGGRNVSSRIHVDDLARILQAVAEHGDDGKTYLAVDDQPVTLADYFDRLAERADVIGPRSTPKWLALFIIGMFGLTSLISRAHAPLSYNLYALVTANYPCANTRVRSELGVKLAYPTYVEGVESLVTQDATDV